MRGELAEGTGEEEGALERGGGGHWRGEEPEEGTLAGGRQGCQSRDSEQASWSQTRSWSWQNHYRLQMKPEPAISAAQLNPGNPFLRKKLTLHEVSRDSGNG